MLDSARHSGARRDAAGAAAGRHIAGGCDLNRPIRAMIEGAGFRIDRIETGYIKGPMPMTYMYEGSAPESMLPMRRSSIGRVAARCYSL
jgi:hypothetical protein